MGFAVLVLAAVAAVFFFGDRRGVASRSGPRPGAAAFGRRAVDSEVGWRTALALAHFEARRQLRHPAFVFGIAITPLMLWLATSNATEGVWWRAELGIALGMVPLGWMAIIAANLGTLSLDPPTW